MQIVETANEGLKRGYTVTIPANEIAARIEGEVGKIAPQMKMAGFRPGKVPANLVRKMHGAQLHQEALNTTIREAMDQLVAEQRLRPAMQPDVALGEGYAQGQDAELTVSLEVLPVIEAPSLEGLKLDKVVVPVTDSEVDAAVERLADQQKRFADAAEDHAAQSGDQLLVDFLGKLDGDPFEGGTAEKQAIEIGAGRLIPGFEEQLVGARAGEQRTIAVTFPADYGAAQLAGKDATFDITVHSVRAPIEGAIDDEFAKQLGLESLDQLRGLFRGQLEQEVAGQTRTQMKRALLDQLAAAHAFEVPPSMVEAEFAQISEQLKQEAAREDDPAAALAEIDAEEADYRAIAERRVRLGLLLSEIGQSNGIEVSQQEMQTLIAQAAQQYSPADRQRFADYVRSEPMAAAQLRAPLYEDKVVDFLIGRAEVTEREATREELQAAIEAEDGGGGSGGHVHGPDCDHGHDHAAQPDHQPSDADVSDMRPADAAGGSDEATASDVVGPSPKKRAPARKKVSESATGADIAD